MLNLPVKPADILSRRGVWEYPGTEHNFLVGLYHANRGLSPFTKALKWLSLAAVALLLALILVVVLFIRWEPIVAKPEPLHDHPNAHWSGGVDGGAFFEITDADPPRYFLEIRYENGTFWAQGWVNGRGLPLTSRDFLGYYGGDTAELKNGKQLQLEKEDGAPIDMD